MAITYLLMPSGPSFPAAGEADRGITFHRNQALFNVDRSAAGRDRGRMALHHPDYDWIVEAIEQSHDEGFIVVGHPR
jgi:hypothetical protein